MFPYYPPIDYKKIDAILSQYAESEAEASARLKKGVMPVSRAYHKRLQNNIDDIFINLKLSDPSMPQQLKLLVDNYIHNREYPTESDDETSVLLRTIFYSLLHEIDAALKRSADSRRRAAERRQRKEAEKAAVAGTESASTPEIPNETEAESAKESPKDEKSESCTTETPAETPAETSEEETHVYQIEKLYPDYIHPNIFEISAKSVPDLMNKVQNDPTITEPVILHTPERDILYTPKMEVASVREIPFEEYIMRFPPSERLLREEQWKMEERRHRQREKQRKEKEKQEKRQRERERLEKEMKNWGTGRLCF